MRTDPTLYNPQGTEPPPPRWAQALGKHCRIPPDWIAGLGTIGGDYDFITFYDPEDDTAPTHYRDITAAGELAAWKWAPPGLRPPAYTRLWEPLRTRRPPADRINRIMILEGETSAIVAAYIEEQAGGGEEGGKEPITPDTDIHRYADRGAGDNGYALIYGTTGAVFPDHHPLAAHAAAADIPIHLIADQDAAGERWAAAARRWAGKAGAEYRERKLPPADIRSWWRAQRLPAPHARHRLLNQDLKTLPPR